MQSSITHPSSPLNPLLRPYSISTAPSPTDIDSYSLPPRPPPVETTSINPVLPLASGSGSGSGSRRKSGDIETNHGGKVGKKDKEKDNGPLGGAKKERKTRSRLACLGCKATKQKCDGPPSCRRCELYSTECIFPPSTTGASTSRRGAHPTPSAKPKSKPPFQPSELLTQQQPLSIPPSSIALGAGINATSLFPGRRAEDFLYGAGGSNAARPFGSERNDGSRTGIRSPLVGDGMGPDVHNGVGRSSDESLVLQKLMEISHRLISIESTLSLQQQQLNQQALLQQQQHQSRYFSPHQSPTSSVSGDDNDAQSDHHPDLSDSVGLQDRTNPIQCVNESIDLVVGSSGPLLGGGMGSGFVGGDGRKTLTGEDYGAPDVIRRGLLSEMECQRLFDFFFVSIHPWVMMLSLSSDSNAMHVRDRSPLLFHTILLLSTSYTTPFPSPLHVTLITYTNSILAPQILSPQPHELTTDFLRALDLLNLYKPTQIAARRADGMGDADAMRASKVNGLASWMLQGILARTSERLALPSVITKFARAYSGSSSGGEISPQIVRDLRLYYWLLSNDVHGNVQSGRRCNMDGSLALSTTRLFSSLNLQPYDTRLAASVEMFEIARPILRSFSYERTRRISRVDLERYNTGMATWETYWLPILIQQLGVDSLAMSVLCPFAYFITLTFNAAAYVSWKQDRSYDSAASSTSSPTGSGGAGEGSRPPSKRVRLEGPRGLNEWEFASLERCVGAAESLIFTLSVESTLGVEWRKVNWEEAAREEGWRSLVLDTSVVEMSSWGMDAITCVAYIFPLVFLGKLVNEGILTADLILLDTPTVQPPWLYTQKLPRLLELGATFLEAIAINPHHPAKSQAQVLRALLDAGVKGRTPAPKLPRHASVVMSPRPISSPSAEGHFSLHPLQPVPSQAQVQGFSDSQLVGSLSHLHHLPPPSHQRWSSTPGGSALALHGGNSLPLSPAAMFAQHQQQRLQSPAQAQAQGQEFLTFPSHGASIAAAGAGMDETFTAVLDGFDLGETSAFWEWGGGGNGVEVDWSQLA